MAVPCLGGRAGELHWGAEIAFRMKWVGSGQLQSIFNSRKHKYMKTHITIFGTGDHTFGPPAYLNAVPLPRLHISVEVGWTGRILSQLGSHTSRDDGFWVRLPFTGYMADAPDSIRTYPENDPVWKMHLNVCSQF